MAPKWGDLIQSEEFQSLDDTGKEIFRDNYFNQAVVPLSKRQRHGWAAG